jgi:hypothetical protein
VGRPWLFYEEVDRYLGPWSVSGYPIGYGKKYCVLFSSNRKLESDPAGAAWVRRTLLLLQTELTAFIVDRYAKGTLGSLTEAELRAAAFDSHPKAYTQAGLTLVVMIAPVLVFELALIPKAEFKPSSESFGATVRQVIDTASIVIPQGIAMTLATAAGPAHNRSLSIALARDQAHFFEQIAEARELGMIQECVTSGRCDHLGLLARLERGLLLRTFEDPGAQRVAARIVNAIRQRMDFVKTRYLQESATDSSLLPIFRQFDSAFQRGSP